MDERDSTGATGSLAGRRLSDASSAGTGGDSSNWLNAHSQKVLDSLETNVGKRDNYLRLAQGVHRRQSLLRSYNIGIEVDRRKGT